MTNELVDVKRMQRAIRHMQKYTKRSLKDESRMLRDAKHQGRDLKRGNHDLEVQDVEHEERDIARFLHDVIIVMRNLIQVEVSEDDIEKKESIPNPYKAQISREVRILLKEMRRIGLLDRETK